MELTRTEMLPGDAPSGAPRRRGLTGRPEGPRGEALSRLRQRLHQAEQRRALLVGTLLEPGWMLAGSLVTRWTVCGKPGCRCARGERHGPQRILMLQDGGHRRAVVVHRGRDDARVDAQRRYRAHRAALRGLKALEAEVHTMLKEIAAYHRMESPRAGS